MSPKHEDNIFDVTTPRMMINEQYVMTNCMSENIVQKMRTSLRLLKCGPKV